MDDQGETDITEAEWMESRGLVSCSCPYCPCEQPTEGRVCGDCRDGVHQG